MRLSGKVAIVTGAGRRIGAAIAKYDSEIKDIVRLLININSVNQLAVGIQKVFIESFEEDLTIKKCYPVALKIWNKLS